MKFIIHHDNELRGSDTLVLEGETVEDVQRQAAEELTLRHWNEDDCWSEEVKS